MRARVVEEHKLSIWPRSQQIELDETTSIHILIWRATRWSYISFCTDLLLKENFVD